MSLKLYLSMMTAITGTFALASLGIILIGEFLGGFYLIPAILFAAFILFSQWLIAPTIIEFTFKLKPARALGYGWLEDVVERIARDSGLKTTPKVYVADTNMANAFAFGNAILGKKVAVTRGLLEILDREEIEAVIGHELGHIKHRDVEVMMALSILPTIFYLIGRSIYYSSWYGGGRDRDESSSILALIALLSYIMYYLVSLFVLWVSRIREYYADRHAAENVPDGNIKLARALVKLQYYNSREVGNREARSITAFKALMFVDPEVRPIISANINEVIELEASRKISLGERIKEIFSTHPLTPKRIRNLLRN